jgi:hypothetical protein
VGCRACGGVSHGADGDHPRRRRGSICGGCPVLRGPSTSSAAPLSPMQCSLIGSRIGPVFIVRASSVPQQYNPSSSLTTSSLSLHGRYRCVCTTRASRPRCWARSSATARSSCSSRCSTSRRTGRASWCTCSRRGGASGWPTRSPRTACSSKDSTPWMPTVRSTCRTTAASTARWLTCSRYAHARGSHSNTHHVCVVALQSLCSSIAVSPLALPQD